MVTFTSKKKVLMRIYTRLSPRSQRDSHFVGPHLGHDRGMLPSLALLFASLPRLVGLWWVPLLQIAMTKSYKTTYIAKRKPKRSRGGSHFTLLTLDWWHKLFALCSRECIHGGHSISEYPTLHSIIKFELCCLKRDNLGFWTSPTNHAFTYNFLTSW